MSSLYLTQTLNSIQLGALLFMLASGLTLILGIMNFVNLAHGSLYMMGAYFAAAATNYTGYFLAGIVISIVATMVLGIIVDRLVLQGLYARDHLDQVLATFGLILFFNELVRIVWGPNAIYASLPEGLSGTIAVFGMDYSMFRFAIIVVGLLTALGLWWLISQTRVGMLIRAGATDAVMVSVMGVNIKLVNMLIFGVGAGLAALAGAMVGPLLSVQSGMGEPILILTLVVIIVGGIGSIRGAFYAAMIIGFVETFGSMFLPLWLSEWLPGTISQGAGPAVASMLIYILMAIVLAIRPQGLFARAI